jgi:carnitine-CoA ligase
MSLSPLDFALRDWSYDRILKWRAEHTPALPFLCFEGGDYQSYGELWSQASGLARGLSENGVRKGDRVAILAKNSLTAVHLWLAVNLLGATDGPINPAFRGQPLLHSLNMLGATIILVDNDLLHTLREIEPDLVSLKHVFSFGDDEAAGPDFQRLTLAPLSTLRRAASRWQPPGASFNDISSILMTSGTSGPSKGVMVPQAQAILIARNSVVGMRVTESDIFYCAHPVFHMSPRYCALTAAMLVGARVWLDVSFKADQWLNRVRSSRATVTIGHGPLLEMIFAQPAQHDDADNSLTRIGTAPFPKHIAEAFEKRFGLKGIETWGMTEIGIPCWHPYDEPLRLGSCGKVLSEWFDVKVVNPENDLELPIGEAGELVVRPKYPSTMMGGYYGRPDATIEAWRNLWFHSGDGGYIDRDGWVYYVDRLKDRIRRRAENISSYDIECVAQTFAGVSETAAIGVASEFAGDDDIKLCVVPSPGRTVAPEELIAYLAKTLPHHMVPRYVAIMDALPRTPTKKVQKAALRQIGVTAETWDRKQAGIVLRAIARS